MIGSKLKGLEGSRLGSVLNSLDDSTLSSTLNGLDSSAFDSARRSIFYATRRSIVLSTARCPSRRTLAIHISVRNSVIGSKLKGFEGSRLDPVLNSLDDSTPSSTLNGLDSSAFDCSTLGSAHDDSMLISTLNDLASSKSPLRSMARRSTQTSMTVAIDAQRCARRLRTCSALDSVGSSMLGSALDSLTLSLVLVVLDSSTIGSRLDGSKLGLALDGSTLGSLLNDWPSSQLLDFGSVLDGLGGSTLGSGVCSRRLDARLSTR